MSDIARRLCGRRQDQEPHEEEVEQERARQEARDAQVQQREELFEAITKCDPEHIMKLREQFSFKDVKDIHERTPLHVLADLKTEEKNVKDEVLKQIFIIFKEAGCDVNSVDEFGNTPVKLAAEKGSIQVLKCLLEERANIRLPDKCKIDTPLHWAAKNGMYEATKLLIEHQKLVERQLHLNPQNRDQETPLHLAVQKKHKEIVHLLLLYGADSNLKDKNDFTPLDIARRGQSQDIVNLLTKPLHELHIHALANTAGKGEIVESDSDHLTPACVSMTPLCPAISINYDVHISGDAVAAVGPNAKVLGLGYNRGQNNVSETASLDSSSTLNQIQQLPSPSPSPSTAGSVGAALTPAQSLSITGSAAASSPAATAPLSPEPMDIPRPLPSAPPVEDNDASSR